MQALAAELNLSETTFVLPPADPANTARVRIFHRTAEMPFAGHPNVGTGFVLADRASAGLLRFEEIAGIVEVRLDRDAAGRDRRHHRRAASAGRRAEMPVDLAAACAGIAPEGIVTARHMPTIAADGGNPRLLLEVTPAAMAAATPDLPAFRRAVAATPSLGGKLSLYLYRQDGAGAAGADVPPLAGTWEDAATGSAATPLAGFLLPLAGRRERRLEDRPGGRDGPPQPARTSRRDGGRRASAATVGGGCVPVLRGHAVLRGRPASGPLTILCCFGMRTV